MPKPTTPKTDDVSTPEDQPLPDMPESKGKPEKTRKETLYAAYSMPNAVLLDVVVFGVKLDALEYAMDQEPAWKVVPLSKGQSVAGAIEAARS